jgi:hypothetical protein
LFWSICLEGLGRKYLPSIPSVAFYLLKDVVLLMGYLSFRASPTASRVVKSLYGGFQPFWFAAFGWTIIEIFNPAQANLALGLLGLRAYWIWWFAPVIVASALEDPKVKQNAIYLLMFTAVGISVLAAVQFVSPPTSAVNLYSVVNGEEVHATMAMVAATGRARVAATFSFLTGFVAFTILVPALLLSIGVGTDDPKLRKYALVSTAITSAVVPMSGSRSAVIMAVAVLVITASIAGLVFTRVGRRIMIGGIAAAILAFTAFPDAMDGVFSRFENRSETTERVLTVFEVVPFVAMATYEYPIGGIGTGMQQTARFPMGVVTDYNNEYENGRYLVELGLFGYAMVWLAKLGLCISLVRAYRILKRAGKKGAAGAAMSYAFVSLLGSLAFDHVWQALFFLGCGFILAEVVAVKKAQVAVLTPAPEPAATPVRRAAAFPRP